MKKSSILLLFFAVSVLFTTKGYSQSVCEVVGEVSIEVVKRGAFVACTRSANPTACTIALAADACGNDPACSGVVQKLTEKGCTWTVEVVGDKIRIYGKAAMTKMDEMKKTYDALNTVEGIRWIEDSMLGY